MIAGAISLVCQANSVATKGEGERPRLAHLDARQDPLYLLPLGCPTERGR